MVDVKLEGAVRSADKLQAHYIASDPKASYILLNPEAPKDYDPNAVEWVSGHRVDYNLTNPDKPEVMLPMSYMSIDSVEEGAEYFRRTTKYPDMVCEMLARYEWGDLRYTTKKEFRNLKKKTSRKGPKGPKTIQIKKGAHFVSFS